MIKFYGYKKADGGVIPWGDIAKKQDYILVLDEQTKQFTFLTISCFAKDIFGWNMISVLNQIETGGWGEFSPNAVRNLFRRHKQSFPRPNVAHVVFFSPKKPATHVISTKPATIHVMSSTPKLVLGAGKLYFNTHTKQVERVVDVQGNLVWVSRHKQEAKAYGRTNFRKATDAEVNNYLDEAKNNG